MEEVNDGAKGGEAVYEDSSDDDNFEIVIENMQPRQDEIGDIVVEDEIINEGFDKEKGGDYGLDKAVNENTQGKSRKADISEPQRISKQPQKMMKMITSKKGDMTIKNNNNSKTSPGLTLTNCPQCKKQMLKRNIRRHMKVSSVTFCTLALNFLTLFLT